MINANFTATYLKVGTFKIVGGVKQGGNVASYFCLADGTVLHAVPGKVDADTLIKEARYAVELRKATLTAATDLASGKSDLGKAKLFIRKAHADRYKDAGGPPAWSTSIIPPRASAPRPAFTLPTSLPTGASTQAQADWLLAVQPLPKLETLYPIVWERVLGETLSTLPVAVR
ncbi:MAG: hypothetical protein U0793_10360 [Gemmataceae bacterium]